MNSDFLLQLQELINTCSCLSDVISMQIVVSLWKTKHSNNPFLSAISSKIDYELQMKYLYFQYSPNEEQW